ncbi:MAG: hypothetical protein AABZ49_03590 [Thermoproteota archaeon]
MVEVAIEKALILPAGIVVVAVLEKTRFDARVVSPVMLMVEEKEPVVPDMPPVAVRVEADTPPAVMVRPPLEMMAPLVITILSRVSTFWV